MIHVLHGDDQVNVHARLSEALESAQRRGDHIVRIAGKGLGIPDLETAMGTQGLFATEKLVVIDGLLSLPKSKLKDTMCEWISSRSLEGIDVYLVEPKLLTVTQLKLVPKAEVQVYKLPALLFQFVENLGNVPAHAAITTFHQILTTQDVEFVFAMLVRQIRTLIAYRADGVYTGPPFGRQKIERQAKNFSLEKLLTLHALLRDIDYRQKTSTASLTLVQEIDLLLAQV